MFMSEGGNFKGFDNVQRLEIACLNLDLFGPWHIDNVTATYLLTVRSRFFAGARHRFIHLRPPPFRPRSSSRRASYCLIFDMPGSKPWKQRAKKRLSSMFRPDRLPSQMPHPTSSLSQSPVSRMSQSLSALPSTISNHLPNVASTPASQTSAIRMPAVATQTMSNIPLGTPNLYLEFTGSHTTPSSPPTRRQRMKMIASTAYAGITEIFQGIYDCSDMFLPLKTVAGLFLTISKVVEVRMVHVPHTDIKSDRSCGLQKVSGNETQLRELGRKLETILSIVQKYSDNDGIPVLKHRIEKFCECV